MPTTTMKYDFTSIIDRHGKDAIAVDGLVPGGHGPQPPKEGFDILLFLVPDRSLRSKSSPRIMTSMP